MYRSFTARELKSIVGRKWKVREGTLENEKEKEAEDKEAKNYPTQDAIIGHLFKLNNK